MRFLTMFRMTLLLSDFSLIEDCEIFTYNLIGDKGSQ